MTRIVGRGATLVTALALLLAGCNPPPPQAVSLPPTVVTAARPIERGVVDTVSFTGRTEGSEYVEVRARVSGYLAKIDFKPGTQVKQGDLLFQIAEAPYRAALNQAEANLGQAQARAQRLNADAERARVLLGKSALGREEYDKIVGDQAESAAALRSYEAAVQRSKLDLNWTKVHSPLDGLVSRDLINVGNLVAADQTRLTTIVKLNPVFVYFDIDERTVLRILKLIREGKFKSARENRVPIRMALANDVGFPHEGYVNFVDNRVDPATGTMRIRATFENPLLEGGAPAISAGLFARVRMELGQPFRALLVTERAIVNDQGQKYLYVVNEKNEVERRIVRLGSLQEGWRVVEDGLKPDDRVVVNGLQRVRPGVTVEAKEGTMNGGSPVSDASQKDSD